MCPTEYCMIQYHMLQESLQKVTKSFRDYKHRVLIISGGILIHHYDLLAFTLEPKLGIGCFFQWLPPPTHLFLPSQDSPGTGSQWASNHCSGKRLLTCWLHILPLAPALPKTTFGFSKMHSSVSYWMNYWGFSIMVV